LTNRWLAVGLLLPLMACGGGNGSITGPSPAGGVTSVTISPAAATVRIGETLPFTATVNAADAVDTSVNWAVDNVVGGTAGSGTISTSGVYVSPYPAPATVTITATSKADTTKSASAVVTLIQPPAATGPDLLVDAAVNRHPISPLIYGMNQYAASFDQVAPLVRLPLERWGGDAATRYNWQLDVYNSASDYYFLTDPNSNSGYPDVSEFNSTVERDRRVGTLTMGTVPMIGWTTKREKACGFSVTKYGPQKATDPYNPDCGNGVRPDGSNIVPDPNDTSVPIGTDFTRAWVQYLVGRYGGARRGGVAFYNLDNEPDYWEFVHRDVHPDYPGYDDLASVGISYATAIKSVDPDAKVTGPVGGGWMGFFYSPQDWRSGWNTGPNYVYYGNPVDRRAHGDVPFVEWYLQQFAAASRRANRRLLDYLDLHGYIAPDEVQFKDAGDTALQQLRLDAVRAFWDSSYHVGGSVNDQPYLVPRMRDWVARNYPGTLTAITEYNLGALDHINGAIAQADLLGVFGREGLDLAAIWAPPSEAQPGLFSFKIYRNYDDAGSGFGDVSVQATSADQSKLSVYAAERSNGDRALIILVLNKTFGELSSTIAVSGFNGPSAAATYRYGLANAGQIARLPDQPVGRTFSATFPATSMTLFVLPAR
jgi:hypothetical protein